MCFISLTCAIYSPVKVCLILIHWSWWLRQLRKMAYISHFKNVNDSIIGSFQIVPSISLLRITSLETWKCQFNKIMPKLTFSTVLGIKKAVNKVFKKQEKLYKGRRTLDSDRSNILRWLSLCFPTPTRKAGNLTWLLIEIVHERQADWWTLLETEPRTKDWWWIRTQVFGSKHKSSGWLMGWSWRRGTHPGNLGRHGRRSEKETPSGEWR